MRFAFGIGAPTDRGFGLRTWLAFLLASSFATAIPGSACAEDVPWLWRPGHTSASTNGPGRGLAATPKTGLGLQWVSERDPAVWRRGERWRIPFSDGDSAVLRLSNVEVGAQGGIDVQGTWEGEPGSVARLRFRGRTAAGYWTRGDGTRWVLVPENGGDSRLRRVEPDSGGRCGNADLAETTSGPDLTGIVGEEDRRPARAVASASPAIESLDLLILYTAAAEEGAGGEAGIRVLAELSVAEANDVFERSAVRARLRLVGAVRVDYAESGDLGNDLNRLTRAGDGWLDEAHRLRDAHAA
ncbi:MAG: hypothetical protein JNL97_09065, partial [Verrucomicrobiales bacterium]|nr:hypothetical protein [Verrucomicrobiales bacterium]